MRTFKKTLLFTKLTGSCHSKDSVICSLSVHHVPTKPTMYSTHLSPYKCISKDFNGTVKRVSPLHSIPSPFKDQLFFVLSCNDFIRWWWSFLPLSPPHFPPSSLITSFCFCFSGFEFNFSLLSCFLRTFLCRCFLFTLLACTYSLSSRFVLILIFLELFVYTYFLLLFIPFLSPFLSLFHLLSLFFLLKYVLFVITL